MAGCQIRLPPIVLATLGSNRPYGSSRRRLRVWFGAWFGGGVSRPQCSSTRLIVDRTPCHSRLISSHWTSSHATSFHLNRVRRDCSPAPSSPWLRPITRFRWNEVAWDKVRWDEMSDIKAPLHDHVYTILHWPTSRAQPEPESDLRVFTAKLVTGRKSRISDITALWNKHLWNSQLKQQRSTLSVSCSWLCW